MPGLKVSRAFFYLEFSTLILIIRIFLGLIISFKVDRMTKSEVMAQLEAFGNENTKKIFQNHGAKGDFFGVKVGDLKKIQKKVKKNYELSLELYETGNVDAMYLAGLIADEKKMTKADLQKWVQQSDWYMINEYTVPWIAAESAYGFELGMEWIDSDDQRIAAAGWATLGSVVAVKSDDSLNLTTIEQLLERAEQTIHNAGNRTRYTMNNFIIAVGSYIESLTEKAREVASSVGKVHVEMGGTACKVPLASTYIQKVIDMGRVGKKRKMARC